MYKTKPRNRNSLQTEPIVLIDETHLVINAQLQAESTLQSKAHQNKVFPSKTENRITTATRRKKLTLSQRQQSDTFKRSACV